MDVRLPRYAEHDSICVLVIHASDWASGSARIQRPWLFLPTLAAGGQNAFVGMPLFLFLFIHQSCLLFCKGKDMPKFFPKKLVEIFTQRIKLN
jgi:hypothetical protein